MLKKYDTLDILECYEHDPYEEEVIVSCQRCKREIIINTKEELKAYNKKYIWFDHSHDWFFCSKKCSEK